MVQLRGGAAVAIRFAHGEVEKFGDFAKGCVAPPGELRLPMAVSLRISNSLCAPKAPDKCFFLQLIPALNSQDYRCASYCEVFN